MPVLGLHVEGIINWGQGVGGGVLVVGSGGGGMGWG